METTTQKTGIIYVRVSSAEQVENTSLESQERYCREFAERQGISIVEPPFIERGESAKSAKRTEFQKAITRCTNKKKPVSYFIVHKLDRFARNQADHVVTRAFLKHCGTELRSVTEPINETPVGRAMEGMISVFAEFDNNVRTERTRGGMMARIQQGVWCWQAPLGYYRPSKKSNIAPQPEVAPYILLAFQEYAKGTYTHEALATYLGDRGMRTKKGKRPGPQLMEKILRNEIYCGVISALGEELEGSFEPIVSKGLFYKCQKGNIAIRRSHQNPLFPLRRFALCSECLQGLTGSSSRGKMGKKYPYYHHPKQDCERAIAIPKSTLEQLFVELLEDVAPTSKFEKMFRGIVLDNWQGIYKHMDENNARARREIEALELERQRIFDQHRTGNYTDDEFLQQKRLVNERINQKYQFIEDNRVEELDVDAALDVCFYYARSSALKWKKGDFAKKLRLQGLIFKSQVPFDGERFGTPELCDIYTLNKEYGGDKNRLVAPRRIELLLTA